MNNFVTVGTVTFNLDRVLVMIDVPKSTPPCVKVTMEGNIILTFVGEQRDVLLRMIAGNSTDLLRKSGRL